MQPAIARRAWTVYEPYHASGYFAPEMRQHLEATGLKGGWMCYFASRSAPMGAVTAPVVSAAFCYFHPAMVGRAIPDAWAFATPTDVIAARYAGADVMLRRLLDGQIADDDLREAADLARAAAESTNLGGRALSTATAALEWPDEPHLVLWHAATVLREHRGDGHVAALISEGLDGLDALVTAAGAGKAPAELLRTARGWSADEWAAANDRLRERGLVSATGELTAVGQRIRDSLEVRTDALALAPWEHLGEQRTQRLLDRLGAVVERLTRAGEFPYPNPTGLPRPTDSPPAQDGDQ